tara:strand:+ start:746 stop:1045 length:300 start_codon:yes stop_codon:yes gene_type:complete
MDLNKEIRETIAFYCGGTYENRKLATDKILQIRKDKPLPIHVVSFSLFDKVYMDSPFGRYTGIVKGVEESKVIIESHSPMGNGMMLADYDLSDNDWQKY